MRHTNNWTTKTQKIYPQLELHADTMYHWHQINDINIYLIDVEYLRNCLSTFTYEITPENNSTAIIWKMEWQEELDSLVFPCCRIPGASHSINGMTAEKLRILTLSSLFPMINMLAKSKGVICCYLLLHDANCLSFCTMNSICMLSWTHFNVGKSLELSFQRP